MRERQSGSAGLRAGGGLGAGPSPEATTEGAERSLSARDAARAVIGFVRRYPTRLVAMTGFAAVGAGTQAAEPLVVAFLFDEVVGGERSMSLIVALIAGWAALGLVGAGAVRVRDRAAAHLATAVTADMLVALGARTQRARRPNDDKDLAVTVVNGANGVMTGLAKVLPGFTHGTIALTVGAVSAVWLDWRVGIGLLLAVGPVVWLNMWLSRRLQSATARYMRAQKRLVAEARSFFAGVAPAHVRGVGATALATARWVRAVNDLRKPNSDRFVTENYYPPTKAMATGLQIATFSAGLMLPGISYGRLVGFFALARQQFEMMLSLTLWWGMLAEQIPTIEALCNGLDLPVRRASGARLDSTIGVLEFRDVTAEYPNGYIAVSGLTLTIWPGEAIAIVGRSGAGKSSIIRLITESSDLRIRKGGVFLDGESTGRLSVEFLETVFVVVPQGEWIMEDTVRRNLLQDLDGATQEDLQWACSVVGLHDTILSWRDGYDSMIGVGRLSGGQGQRLAIARALLCVKLRGALALILDEPTAALDPEAADQLMDTVLAYLAQAGVAAIVITHRFPVSARLRRVVCIGEGTVLEEGDPRELLRDPASHYRRLVVGSGDLPRAFAVLLADAKPKPDRSEPARLSRYRRVH